MKCPECGKIYPLNGGGYGFGKSRANPDGLPKERNVIDNCICSSFKCGFYLLMSSGDIYKWNERDSWFLFSTLQKNPKYIGGYKVIQNR